MTQDSRLPAAFADLECFVAEWALTGQHARYGKMVSVDMERLRAFYQAMMPRIDAIVSHLNGFSLERMPAPEQTLFDLALTFAESAHPVDFKWRHAQFEEVFPFERFRLYSASQAW